jgi:hypothetical protein
LTRASILMGLLCCGMPPQPEAAVPTAIAAAPPPRPMKLGRLRGRVEMRSFDSQTQFVFEHHRLEWTRIAQLCVPAVARVTSPRLLTGVSTKRERTYVLDTFLTGLERGGWFLKKPVEAMWAGERDVQKLAQAGA